MTLAPIFAQLLKDAPEKTDVWSGGGGGSVLVVLFLLMVGAIVAIWIFMKRGAFPRLKGGEHLQILETRALGGRQFLVVARHHDQTFLLGVCPGRIDYLCSLESLPGNDLKKSFESVLQDKETAPKQS